MTFRTKDIRYFFGVFMFFLGLSLTDVKAQSCDSLTPSFIVDLTGNPDSVWYSPQVVRKGVCCGLDPNASPPPRCIEFWITLDAGAQGIRFDIASGAKPPGALFYELNCGNPTPVGDTMCLNGAGPHRITFCKPGNNQNVYAITSIPAPSVSPPIAVSNGCSGIIFESGYELSSVVWTSVPFNATYNTYMSCSLACDTVLVTAQPGYPAYIDYEVSGTAAGGCNNQIFRDTVRVFFITDKTATILPANPAVCFGGINTSISATGTGGAPPYFYLWSTGDTTQSIQVGVGTYWVMISDTTDCPPVFDTVTVTANPNFITADAGNDFTYCITVNGVPLNGTVGVASGGVWSGGAGNYTPDNTALDAVYTPASSEITAGFVQLVLTTTGNGTCPFADDTIRINLVNGPVVNVGNDQIHCSDIIQTNVVGTATNATGYSWSTSGSGSFSSINSLNTSYSPSSSDTTNGFVVLYLTANGNSLCSAAVDSLVITLTDAPRIEAGTDMLVCSNNPTGVLSGSISVATDAMWSSSGSGSFSPDATTLNATYIPSDADTAAGSVILTLTTTSSGTCLAVSDSILYTITPNTIVADAGGDIIACSTIVTLNGSILNAGGGIWSTSGTGSFDPSNTDLNPTYTFSAADTVAGTITFVLTSTGNGGCLAEKDSVTVQYFSRPVSSAGTDLTVCNNISSIDISGTVSNSNGYNWTTGGTGSFTNNTSLNTSYLPGSSDTASGSVYLYLNATSAFGCATVKDSILLTLVNSPSANAGSDIWVCSTNASASLNGSINVATGGFWSTNGGGTFSPDINTLNATYTPSNADTANGTIILTLTTTGNGICSAEVDTVYFNITTDAISTNAGNDVSICSEFVLLNGMVANATGVIWSTLGSGSFLPSDTLLNTTYVFSSADTLTGTVSLILTTTGNGGCQAKSDTIKIAILEPIHADITAIDTTCGNTSVLIDVVVTTTEGFWSTLGNGSFIFDSTSLNNQYLPGSDDIINGNVTLVFLSTNNGPCVATTDTVEITLLPAPFNDFSHNNTCLNDSTHFFDLTSTVGTIVSWDWEFENGANSNEINPSYWFSSPGTYPVTLTTVSNYGCIDSLTKQVIVHPLPVAEFSNTAQCFVDSVYFTDLSTVASGNVNAWAWSFGNGTVYQQNPGHFYSAPGVYSATLIVTSEAGCKDTITKSYEIIPAPIPAFKTDSVCLNTSINFENLSSIVFGSIVSQEWTFGDGNSSSSISPDHLYNSSGSFNIQLILTSDRGCKDTLIKQAVIYPLPVADFNSNGFCLADAVIFADSSIVNSGTISSWQWYFGDGGQSTLANPSHFYPSIGTWPASLIVSTDKGCRDTITLPVTIQTSPVANFTATPTIVHLFDQISFTDNSTGAISWQYDFADSIGNSTSQHPVYSYNSGGFFNVMQVVTNSVGCTDTILKTVLVTMPPLVPTGFTPNGDGHNDVFFVKGGPYRKLDFKIYNNWGELIFYSDKQSLGWDGRRDGVAQPMGVYVYLLTVETEDGVTHDLQGDVTLLR